MTILWLYMNYTVCNFASFFIFPFFFFESKSNFHLSKVKTRIGIEDEDSVAEAETEKYYETDLPTTSKKTTTFIDVEIPTTVKKLATQSVQTETESAIGRSKMIETSTVPLTETTLNSDCEPTYRV